jgi:hypothetical protein
MSDSAKIRRGRDGRPFLANRLLVPVAYVFDAGSEHRSFRVDSFHFGDSFDLDFARLDAILVGECHQCGAAVDHRRGVELGDDHRLPIEIALVPPSTFIDPRGIEGVGSMLQTGWGIAPICDPCRRERVRAEMKLALEALGVEPRDAE